MWGYCKRTHTHSLIMNCKLNILKMSRLRNKKKHNDAGCDIINRCVYVEKKIRL